MSHTRQRRAELLAARHAAHEAFDPLWQEFHFSRPGAYAWLSEATGIRREECHFSMFDVGMCEAVIVLCRRKLRDMRRAAKVRQKHTQGKSGRRPQWAR
jgi:hypothetical protein